MIHLFNKVFIEQEFLISTLVERVVIGDLAYNSDVVREPDENDDLQVIASSSQKISDGPFECGRDLEDLLDGSTMEDFIDHLMAKENKVVIYSEPTSFAKILGVWLKSSTNMDQDAFDLYADCYGHDIKILSKGNDDLIAQMKTAFAEASAIDLSEKVFTPSVEFGLASAFYDINFSRKDKFVTLVSSFIKREYENSILETRRHIDNYILNPNLQAALGGSGKTIHNYGELPGMSAFVGDHWIDELTGVPSGNSYDPGASSKLSLSAMSANTLTDMIDVCMSVNLLILDIQEEGLQGATGLASLTTANNLFQYAESVRTGNITDEEFAKAMQQVLDEPIAMIWVAPMDLFESILSVFMTHVKNLKNSDNIDELYKYTLK